MDLDFDKYCLVDRQSPTTVVSKTTIKGTSVERKKIELSQANAPSFSFEIIDSLCTSDEDGPIITSLSGKETSVCSHNIDSGLWASMVPTESVSGPVNSSNGHKSRFKPVKKIFDPFVKSKLRRSSSSNSNERTNNEKENMQSSSSSIAHLHGLLKLGKRRGVPFFEFSVKSMPEDFYLAKIKRAENGLFDWFYTFHSLHKGGKTSRKLTIKDGNRALSSNMLGHMHVSCNPCENSEFVLYESKNNNNNSSRFKSPELEILAVVVKVPLAKKTEEGILVISHPPAETHVVVPAGAHGSPAGGGRPSRLIDRWRRGGECDCGGWDMSCPIDIFSCPNINVENADVADGRNIIPTKLFFEGKKDNLPAFDMKVITGEEGKLYQVDFHARLSSLQAFAICVAILHAEAEASGRKMGGGQVSRSDSLRIVYDKEDTEEEEDCEDKLIEQFELPSFVLNPPFSPIARV